MPVLDPRLILQTSNVPQAPVAQVPNTLGSDFSSSLNDFLATQRDIGQTAQEQSNFERKQSGIEDTRAFEQERILREEQNARMENERKLQAKKTEDLIRQTAPFARDEVLPLIEKPTEENIAKLTSKTKARIRALKNQGRDPSNSEGLLRALEEERFDVVREQANVVSEAGRQLGVFGKDRKDVNLQFGSSNQRVRDELGNDFFITTRRDPQTGGIDTVFSPISGDKTLQPQGKLTSLSGSGLTEKEKADITVETEKRKKESAADVKAEEEAAKRKTQAQETRKSATPLVDELLTADLDKIYGLGEQLLPDIVSSESTNLLRAKKDQLMGILEAGVSKVGQGSISDSERVVFRQAVSVLGAEGIDPDDARKELQKIKNILDEKAGEKSVEDTQSDILKDVDPERRRKAEQNVRRKKIEETDNHG